MEDFINRIGTDRHKYKLEFVLRKLKFSKELTGSIYVSIRRGKHKVDSQPVEMNAEKTCNLGKQVLTFPGITLFYDTSASAYQKKQGQMKILSVNSNGDKKLLGIVIFDVAVFANAQRNGKSEESSKIKGEVTEIPQKLKMRAELDYSVFVKFIGEGSETDNSVRDDKLRNQSPLDKLKNFFFGNDQEKQKKPPSPKKTQLTNSKKSRNKPSDVDMEEAELEEVPPKKMRSVEKKKNDEKGSNRKKEKKGEVEDQIEAEEDLFNFTKEPLKNKDKGKDRERDRERERNNSKSKKYQSESEELDRRAQQKKTDKSSKRTAQKGNLDSRNGQSDRFVEQRHSKPPKNIVKQQQRDNLTQYEQKSRKVSNYNKSEPQPTQNQNEESDVNIYFDDPKTFKHLEEQPKKFNKVKEPKTPQISQSNDSEGQEKMKEITPKEKVQVIPSPQRKVKENSIHLSSKEIVKEKKKKKQDPAFKEEITDHVKVEGREEEVKSKIGEQTKNLFTNFEQPTPKRGDKALSYNLKKTREGEDQIFLKEELQRKQRELIELSNKLHKYGQIQRKLKEEQAQRKAGEKTIGDLKEQNARLQQELKRAKEENESMRSEKQNQSSFFRETQNHYLNNSEDVSLEEENKRLEREKNEVLVTLAKEKQRQKKEAKEFREQLEKQRLKYKELENVSKIDLKKLKDQTLKLSGNLQSAKDKLKQKAAENDTLLQENKVLNGLVIELKEKLGSLKFKICEKLNEANENGEAELMEVLTDLSEDI